MCMEIDHQGKSIRIPWGINLTEYKNENHNIDHKEARKSLGYLFMAQLFCHVEL